MNIIEWEMWTMLLQDEFLWQIMVKSMFYYNIMIVMLPQLGFNTYLGIQ